MYVEIPIMLEIDILYGSKYLLPGKILRSKLDPFGRKILMTKDDPLPQPTAARTNFLFDHEE